MIDSKNEDISIRRQCKLLSVDRGKYYYHFNLIMEADKNEKVKERIQTIFTELPFYGHRRMQKQLKREGFEIGKKKVNHLMKEMGLHPIFPKKNLSKAASYFEKYEYLLRNLNIERVNQVWQSDLTYLKVNGCNVYLVGIIDVFSRKLLSWRLSNSLSKEFCIEALEDACFQYGTPEIFNTDQGSQFTSIDFQKSLTSKNIKLSMVGKGRATDNIYIERFWRTLKYEEIFLKEYLNLKDCKNSVRNYLSFYNERRLHQSLDYQTPNEVYFKKMEKSNVA